MTQYRDEVEKQRLYLAAESWGNEICQHYSCRGGGDIGFGEGYFVYYNNGAVHKLSGKDTITIMQVANSIQEVMDDYERKDI